MIQSLRASRPMRNHDFRRLPWGFARDGFHAHGLGGASVGPYCCQHDDDDEGCELVGIGDVGVLDIEAAGLGVAEEALDAPPLSVVAERQDPRLQYPGHPHQDRKSTRLNSSHMSISYAVFC